MNILILSAGRRVSLLRSFEKEIDALQLPSKVFAADSNPEQSTACRLASRHFKLPTCSDKNFVATLLSICEENKIVAVIPTIDMELLVLSRNYESFSKRGISVIVSDAQVIEICDDKAKTHQFFQSKGVKVPEEYSQIDKVKYPCFVKPRVGNSSIDTSLIYSKEDFRQNHWEDDSFLKIKYLSPNEYTEFSCDIYFNKNGKLICSVPRERIQVRGGEVSKSQTDKNQIVDFLKEKFEQWEGARGCITVQVFKHATSGVIYGIEINPRFGGGYPLTYSSGANYSKWIIEEYLLNQQVEDYFDSWEENLLMLRYDQEVFVHAD